MIQVQGIDILVEGPSDAQAPTLLMVHGWPDTHRLWDAQAAYLQTQWRCVRFTLPGFDVSQPPRKMALDELVAFFKAVADAVSPDAPVSLLLHDWGCVFGYEFAARHPDRVARIVGVDIGDANSGAFVRSLGIQAKLAIAFYQLWLAAAYRLGALGDRMTRFMARRLRCTTNPAHIGAQQNYPYVLQWSGGLSKAAHFLPHGPMLYIYGARKPFMFHSAQWLEKLSALPGCAVQGFATGHWVMVQQPQAFNQCVGDWLKA